MEPTEVTHNDLILNLITCAKTPFLKMAKFTGCKYWDMNMYLGATIQYSIISPILQVKKQRYRKPMHLVEHHTASKREGQYANAGGLLQSLGSQPPSPFQRKQNKSLS